MVASAVMALAIAVGGFGTTALLASQPAGPDGGAVGPAVGGRDQRGPQHQKKDDKKEAPKPSKDGLCILGGGEHRCVCRAARCPQPE